MKYTLLDGTVYRRLDNLTLALIGNPQMDLQFEGVALVDYYDRVHLLSEFGKIFNKEEIKVKHQNYRGLVGWFCHIIKISYPIWKLSTNIT